MALMLLNRTYQIVDFAPVISAFLSAPARTVRTVRPAQAQPLGTTRLCSSVCMNRKRLIVLVVKDILFIVVRF